MQPSAARGVLLKVCRGARDGSDRSLAAVAGGVPCHAGAGARGVHAVSRLRAGRDRPDLGQSKRRAVEHQSKRLQPERGTFGGVGAERHEPERHAVDLRAAGDGAVAAARRAEREPRHARRGAAEPRRAGPEPGSKEQAPAEESRGGEPRAAARAENDDAPPKNQTLRRADQRARSIMGSVCRGC